MKIYHSIAILSLFFLANASFAQLQNKNWRKEAFLQNEISNSTFVGKACLRFELNKNDRIISGGKRTEISTPAELAPNVDRWYTFSIGIPDSFTNDNLPEIVAQWHAQPDEVEGETWRSPPIALSIKNGHWYLSVKWATKLVNTNKNIDGQYAKDLGLVQKQKWTDWKFHIKFSDEADGQIQAWKNGTQVLNRNGANYYNDKKGPYFKYGIYKWEWNKPALAKDTISKRVVYYTGIRILNKRPS